MTDDLPAYYRAPDDRCLFRVHASMALVDGSQRVLLVQEAKPGARGKWNLPGGHVDHGESVLDAAIRETREETGIEVNALGLVGVYAGPVSIRFAFRADGPISTAPRAGDEILDVRWTPFDEILSSPDDVLVSPVNLKLITQHLANGIIHPLHVITSPPTHH